MPSRDLESSDRERIADLIRVTMVENALHHRGDEPFRSIDPFSAAILESRGLLTVTVDVHLSDVDLAVLDTADGSSRMPTLAGPYVFVREGDRGSVIDPSELLAHSDANRRLAALRYFTGLPNEVLARRSRRLIQEAGPRIASDDRAEWFAAAKGVFDLLRSDVYLTLAGFGQCYAIRYAQGVNEFLSKLLRPNAALLSSIDLECWHPSQDYELAEAVVARLAAADSLSEALADFYRQLGHLPLCGPIGLGQVLRLWVDRHPGENCWDAAWAWADELQSPVAHYHAFTAFLGNPDLVPVGAGGIPLGRSRRRRQCVPGRVRPIAVDRSLGYP